VQLPALPETVRDEVAGSQRLPLRLVAMCTRSVGAGRTTARGPTPRTYSEGIGTMSAIPEFEFVSAAACRDPKVNNCPEVATNVSGVVAFRDSERPATVVTMTPEAWRRSRMP
jgi:hypothetical protein